MKIGILTAQTPWGPVRRLARRAYTHVVVYPVDDQQRPAWWSAPKREIGERARQEARLAKPDAPLPSSPGGSATEHEEARKELAAIRRREENRARLLAETAGMVAAKARGWCRSASGAAIALKRAQKRGFDRAIIVPVDPPNKEVL